MIGRALLLVANRLPALLMLGTGGGTGTLTPCTLLVMPMLLLLLLRTGTWRPAVQMLPPGMYPPLMPLLFPVLRMEPGASAANKRHHAQGLNTMHLQWTQPLLAPEDCKEGMPSVLLTAPHLHACHSKLHTCQHSTMAITYSSGSWIEHAPCEPLSAGLPS